MKYKEKTSEALILKTIMYLLLPNPVTILCSKSVIIFQHQIMIDFVMNEFYFKCAMSLCYKLERDDGVNSDLEICNKSE